MPAASPLLEHLETRATASIAFQLKQQCKTKCKKHRGRVEPTILQHPQAALLKRLLGLAILASVLVLALVLALPMLEMKAKDYQKIES